MPAIQRCFRVIGEKGILLMRQLHQRGVTGLYPLRVQAKGVVLFLIMTLARVFVVFVLKWSFSVGPGYLRL